MPRTHWWKWNIFSWPLLCSANSSTVHREITHILCNTKIYYLRKSQPILSILNQINPFRDLPANLFKIRFNIILPSTPRSSKWSPLFRLPHQNRVCNSPLPHTSHMPHRSHFPSFYHSKRLWWRAQIVKPSLYDVFQFPVTSSLLGPNIFFIILR
jgi:hypothetical protein